MASGRQDELLRGSLWGDGLSRKILSAGRFELLLARLIPAVNYCSINTQVHYFHDVMAVESLCARREISAVLPIFRQVSLGRGSDPANANPIN
jgi:hypothetical protein